MIKSKRHHVPCRVCGSAHNSTSSSSICKTCGPIYALKNVEEKQKRRDEEKQAELEESFRDDFRNNFL